MAFKDQMNALDERREKARISSVDLAEEAGINQFTLSRWRAGVQQPTVDRWAEVSAALDRLIEKRMKTLKEIRSL